MLQADPKFTPQGTMHSVHSFTLIELLVVVAIIGILAVIAVPNFTDALVKCQIARTHADLKSLSHALEAYRIDHQTIPPTAGPFEPSYLERLKRLTRRWHIWAVFRKILFTIDRSVLGNQTE